MQGSDEHWIDLTFLGSRFEEQINLLGDPGHPTTYRHRERVLDGGGRHLDWTPGRAPKERS